MVLAFLIFSEGSIFVIVLLLFNPALSFGQIVDVAAITISVVALGFIHGAFNFGKKNLQNSYDFTNSEILILRIRP